MIFIKLFIITVIIILYGLFASVSLKLLNITATVRSIALFVVSGAAAGITSLIIHSVLIVEEHGHIDHEPEVFSIFLIALLIAVAVSFFTVKIYGTKK